MEEVSRRVKLYGDVLCNTLNFCTGTILWLFWWGGHLLFLFSKLVFFRNAWIKRMGFTLDNLLQQLMNMSTYICVYLCTGNAFFCRHAKNVCKTSTLHVPKNYNSGSSSDFSHPYDCLKYRTYCLNAVWLGNARVLHKDIFCVWLCNFHCTGTTSPFVRGQHPLPFETVRGQHPNISRWKRF